MPNPQFTKNKERDKVTQFDAMQSNHTPRLKKSDSARIVDTKSFFAELKCHTIDTMNITNLRQSQTTCASKQQMHQPISKENGDRTRTHCLRGPLRNRVTLDKDRLKKNRRVVAQYLKRMGTDVGKSLSLNAEGVCYFPYNQKFVIVVEVPADQLDVCFIYTMVCQLGDNDNRMEVLKLAMELNYMQYGTRGATIGLEEDEVNLCFSTPIAGLCTFCDFKAVTEDFMQTAVETNLKLDNAKRTQTPNRPYSRST
jgi:hypothetical protein